jgi:hypothetical protein
MKLTVLSLFLLLILSFVPFSYGQTAESLKVFEPIPSNQHVHLAERLKIFIEYRRTKQWELLFDMFPKTHTQHPEITKDEFLAEVKKFGKPRLINFIPENTQNNITIDGEYIIWGCAEIREGLSKKKWLATLFASLENGEWFFSDISIVIQIDAREPEPCSSKKRK